MFVKISNKAADFLQEKVVLPLTTFNLILSQSLLGGINRDEGLGTNVSFSVALLFIGPQENLSGSAQQQ